MSTWSHVPKYGLHVPRICILSIHSSSSSSCWCSLPACWLVASSIRWTSVLTTDCKLFVLLEASLVWCGTVNRWTGVNPLLKHVCIWRWVYTEILTNGSSNIDWYEAIPFNSSCIIAPFLCTAIKYMKSWYSRNRDVNTWNALSQWNRNYPPFTMTTV